MINKKSPINIDELYSIFKWDNVVINTEIDKKNSVFFLVDYLDKIIKSNKTELAQFSGYDEKD